MFLYHIPIHIETKAFVDRLFEVLSSKAYLGTCTEAHKCAAPTTSNPPAAQPATQPATPTVPSSQPAPVTSTSVDPSDASVPNQVEVGGPLSATAPVPIVASVCVGKSGGPGEAAAAVGGSSPSSTGFSATSKPLTERPRELREGKDAKEGRDGRDARATSGSKEVQDAVAVGEGRREAKGESTPTRTQTWSELEDRKKPAFTETAQPPPSGVQAPSRRAIKLKSAVQSAPERMPDREQREPVAPTMYLIPTHTYTSAHVYVGTRIWGRRGIGIG